MAKQVSLFVSCILWGILVGGVAYSHIVYFPAYLLHLPESTSLITGTYGLQDGHFWMFMHPLLIISMIVTLITNWKQNEKKKYILTATGIYILAIIATAIYFVPELMAFAESAKSTTVTAAEWLERGQKWLILSCIRGTFMAAAFIMMLIANRKTN